MLQANAAEERRHPLLSMTHRPMKCHQTMREVAFSDSMEFTHDYRSQRTGDACGGGQ